MSRKPITRGRVVEAALFSAFKNGLGGVSLSDVAAALEIKKASLYNHFSGKEELLFALYEFAADFYSRVNFFGEEIFFELKEFDEKNSTEKNYEFESKKNSGKKKSAIAAKENSAEKNAKSSAEENAEKIFSRAAKNFVEAHEREPLFQIYSLVASEKYFCKECLEIFLEQKSKLQNQVFEFFKTVWKIKKSKNENSLETNFSENAALQNQNVTIVTFKNEKIFFGELEFASEIFCENFFGMMDSYLAQKKELVRKNPECDAGSLFALPSDEKSLEKISSFAKKFFRKIF